MTPWQLEAACDDQAVQDWVMRGLDFMASEPR